MPWAKRLIGVGGVQAAVQAIAMVSGLLIVRALAPEDYALYVLAHTLLGTMSVLGDSGLNNGALAEGGKVWQSPEKLGQVLATVTRLRRTFALWVIGLSVPVFLYLQRNHGATWSVALALCGITVALFWFSIQSTLHGFAPGLHQAVRQTQRIALIQNFIRLGGVVVAVLLVPFSVFALLGALPGYAWAAVKLRRLSASFASPTAEVDPDVRASVMRVVKRTFPSTVHYVLSGQITLWVLSFLGTTLNIAQIGALGRIGQIFTVFSSIFAVLIIPRFARMPSDRTLLLRRYLHTVFGFMGLGSVIVVFAALFPEPILWVLGSDYAELKVELVLLLLGGAIGLVQGAAYWLASSRGVVVNPVVNVPLLITIQVLLCFILDVGTLRGALWLGIWGGFMQFVIIFFYALFRFGRSI